MMIKVSRLVKTSIEAPPPSLGHARRLSLSVLGNLASVRSMEYQRPDPVDQLLQVFVPANAHRAIHFRQSSPCCAQLAPEDVFHLVFISRTGESQCQQPEGCAANDVDYERSYGARAVAPTVFSEHALGWGSTRTEAKTQATLTKILARDERFGHRRSCHAAMEAVVH